MEKIVKLHSNCIPVNGARRSVICDLDKNSYKFIPNSLYYILTSHLNQPLKKILRAFPAKDHDTIKEYIKWLFENEYVHEIENEENELFLDSRIENILDVKNPHPITNAILDIKEVKQYNIYGALKKLSNLDCPHIQIRIFKDVSKKYLEDLLAQITELESFHSCELVLKFSSNLLEKMEHLIKNYAILKFVCFYNSKKESAYTFLGCNVALVIKNVFSSDDCGYISPEVFRVNENTIFENKCHNSCLHKKIGIDSNGNIKNCPSTNKIFGSIDDSNLERIIVKEDFIKIGSLNKDKIEICQDCEFRYICSDCRAFTHNDNLLSKPSKCNYNPYQAKWKNEKNYIKAEEMQKDDRLKIKLEYAE
jgi:SPASM domain peptide maturase of grasp-with-spasm system